VPDGWASSNLVVSLLLRLFVGLVDKPAFKGTGKPSSGLCLLPSLSTYRRSRGRDGNWHT